MRSAWPNPTFIVDKDQFPVSSPPPESSSPPVATDLTTEPPSASSSDDNTLRTTATVRPTWPNPTFIDQFSVSSPLPESSSPPVATDQTTEPPSGSSSDDNILRTTATMKSTWKNYTWYRSICDWGSVIPLCMYMDVAVLDYSCYCGGTSITTPKHVISEHPFTLYHYTIVTLINCGIYISWSLKITLLS